MIELVGKRVLVVDMEQGERTYNNIIIRNDDGKTHGIRSRWCKVYKVGPEVSSISPGEWIWVEHGRWSQGFKEKDDDGIIRDFWIVDYPKGVLASSDTLPDTFNIGQE